MGRLAEKVVLITGAGSGIGRAAALLFAGEGARVVIAGRGAEAGEETVSLVHQGGGRAHFVATDVTDEESVSHAITEAVRLFGKLDVLYNNAGGSSPNDGRVTETSTDEFWRALKVDLFGTWLCCRFGIPELIKAGGGSVINTTSIVALKGFAARDAYTAAKGGIISLTRSMAVEFAPNRIRVNALAPSATMTDRVRRLLADRPNRRALADRHLLGLAEPNDVANAALFLASDEARMITGQVLPVDSGVSIS